MKKTVLTTLFCFSTCVLLASCTDDDTMTKESKRRETKQTQKKTESGPFALIEPDKREIKYTVKKTKYKENEKAIIYENETPIITIMAKRTLGMPYLNSKNKYTYIVVDFEVENINYPESFEMAYPKIWLLNSEKQRFQQSQDFLEEQPALKGEKGYWKSHLNILEVTEIGNRVTVRYNFDEQLNGSGAGPFTYLDFDLPIDRITKDR
ncbi:hypothetical protein P7E02_11520 [Enterococcus hulanensis]|uniref:hypothetical protein n=1 Tax=Enterococcus hulanensis TaxID=2559929 RepID=UPI002890A620|nr:hypothetical protein [Enterococcus hulanensis]MDT2660501.1 hypothetical protein [Enterococcus hulanensis]